MKNLFRGYYRPSEAQFSSLWKTATIALDANVLLNLYRYSGETRDRLISILDALKDRLWLPHQAAHEFHKNRLKVICDQQDAYSKVDGFLNEHKKQLAAQLGEFRRHPFISVDALMDRCNRAFDAAIGTIASQRKNHPSLPDQDDILESVSNLFHSRVGSPYSTDKLKGIYKEGEARYAVSQPPGYKDAATKQGNERFGDLVLWNQIIDHAKEIKLPIVLVTDDVKDDWWTRLRGKTIGPRPELIAEIYEQASVDFYMYRTDQFMEFSKTFMAKNVSDEMLKEVRDIRSRTIVDSLVSNEQELNRSYETRGLLSMRDNLLKRRAELASEIGSLSTVLDYVVRSEEESDAVRSRRDELLNRIKSLENEISSITSIIDSHYMLNNPHEWKLSADLFEKRDAKSFAERRIEQMRKLIQTNALVNHDPQES